MVAKVGLGIIGVGAISIGGVAFTKPEWLGINKEIIWKPLSQDNGFADSNGTDAYKDKFGSTYKNYLVGTSQDNKAWWNEKVKNIKENEKKGRFKKIKHGFDGTDSLKSLCDEAYKKPASELKGETPDPLDTEFRKSDVWKYCSVGGKQPQTLSEFNTGKSGSNDGKEEYTNRIGSDSDNQNKFLSINSPNNDWIWDLKDKEFKKQKVNEAGYFQESQKDTTKTIKNICKDAYGKEENGSATGVDKITKAEVAKYCSLEKIATT